LSSPDKDAIPTAPASPARAALAPQRPIAVWVLVAALAVTAIAIALAWDTQRRLRQFERELVQRQDASQREATEARTAAHGAQDMARDAAAKAALLEARVTEAAMQRSQIEELLQSVARSRDENVIADVEAAIRVALQQSAITGSAEPLAATLRQADERLARYNQPRLERVRRAVLHDLERVKAQGSVDISTLAARLDEAVRQVDELPMLSVAPPDARTRPGAVAPSAKPSPAAAASASATGDGWSQRASAWWRGASAQVGDELRSLVRVTRIEHADAALIAPDQQFFVRENLKLRLLNARLGLFARQFDSAQADLREASATLDRYFDRASRRVVATGELLRQVGSQARQTIVARPDETLAALTAAAAGR
jgi:uroporphyrin-3 C-methyltransferase